MKVELVEKNENPLLQRVELRFRVDHVGEPTPKRLDVRAQLASQLGVAEELVVVERLAGTYGRQVASGVARAYSTRERLEELEPEYLLKRDQPKEEKAEAKPEEKPKPEKPPKEKPEKPEEAKPEEKPKAKQEKPEAKKPEKPKEDEKAKEVKKPKEGATSGKEG